ncbi:hypothetical protein BWR17_12715 [Phaeobacter inhibens]|uniref:hypothetical protein n=1 Tax=Phaeobacter inhibens TaxID=221822 RepID=UPI000971B7D4|nr:hypothetical protein [Phaeobacter inhibens]APX16600.1 hypothetical protein BWR17_12715 [Phaeobacter inhibens]
MTFNTKQDVLSDLARKLTRREAVVDVLKPKIINDYPAISTCLENSLKGADARGTLMVPELRTHGNETVGIFADYGGEHRSSRYFTYSFLVFGWNHAHTVQDHFREIRAKHSVPESREISYKKLSNGPVQRCLPDYLNVCDSVAGMLCTVAVHKEIKTVFGPPGKETEEFLVKTLEENGFGKRKPKVAEKLLRIIHLSAYLTAWLSHEGHKLFWLSDNDEIAPNPGKSLETVKLFQNVLQLYAEHSFGMVGYATPQEMDKPGTILDFLSMADLAAGAIEGFLSREDKGLRGQQKEEAQAVLHWLGRPGIGLKKHNLVLRPGAVGEIESAELVIKPEIPTNAVIVEIPISRSGKKS